MTDALTRLTHALADRYRVERELGAGGMATVYLAHDLKHDRDVAIKVLHPELGAALGDDRFLSEIKTTAKLQHPHILPLLDSGAAEGLLYYVMPLVTGETLRGRLERERQLPMADAVRLTREVASALDYAHRQGVIHRDIKPENILLHDGSALVADFGIALAVQSAGGGRLTQTGLSLGTPQYMSPEQAMGERTIDARSDVYALGAVAYEMITGDPPFTGSSVQAVVAKVMSAVVEKPSLTRKAVTPGVEAAVLRSLEKLPADRFGTAAEFAAALLVEPAAVASAPSAPAKRGSRVLLASVALLALVAGAAGGWFARRAPAASTIGARRPTRLTHDGRAGCASIAPDGRQFALVVGDFSDESQCAGALVVRPVPTGPDVEVARVANTTEFQWSPAGDAVLFVGRLVGKAEGVWIVPTRGGGPRLLFSTRVSAAGFLSDSATFVITRTPRQLNDTLSQVWLRTLDARSGVVVDSARLPVEPRYRAHASSSGRYLVMASSESPATLIVSRTGQVTDSVINPGGQVNQWVGDSAIVSYPQPDWRPGDLVMRRVDPERGRFVGEATTLVANLTEVRMMNVSTTGMMLWVTRAITDELAITPIPVAGSSRILTRSLNAYLGNPVFSPDGRRVAYTRQDALGSNAYAIDLQTRVETALTGDTLPLIKLFWPSAQQLVRTNDGLDLQLLDLATGRTRTLPLPRGEEFLKAHGNTRLMGRNNRGTLVWRDSLLQHQRVMPIPSDVRRHLSGALSRDGKLYLDLGELLDGRPGYALFNTETFTWSPAVALDTTALSLVALANDGTAYFARITDQTEIWRLQPGRPRSRLATLPVHCYLGSIEVNGDGTLVACNKTTSLPDVWMMPLPGTGR
ncbi:MAG: protein kinase [Gemmatimonadaceae bacterium]|nr:protein kinase [Gemmatimonadaceae bacterium]